MAFSLIAMTVVSLFQLVELATPCNQRLAARSLILQLSHKLHQLSADCTEGMCGSSTKVCVGVYVMFNWFWMAVLLHGGISKYLIHFI